MKDIKAKINIKPNLYILKNRKKKKKKQCQNN